MSLVKKSFVISLVFVFGFVIVGMASAKTVDMNETECNNNSHYWYEDACYTTKVEKLQAQVNVLTERVDNLLKQLQAQETEQEDQQQNEQEEEPEETADNECVGINFDRALHMGMEGEDVRCLQVMLNQELERPIAESGPGSPENETSYYGPKTKAGVTRFQDNHRARVLAPIGLSEGTGYFGQQTRERVREQLEETGWERDRERERERDQELIYCETDEDCVVVKDNCCDPKTGGQVRCINEGYEESWTSELNCDEEDQVCPQVDNRPLPDDCGCVDNTCQTTE